MNNDIAEDIGENYEYVRRIVLNTIEVKKIDYSENIAKGVGNLISIVMCAFLGFNVFILLLVLGGIWLFEVVGSVILTIAIIILIHLLLVSIFWFFRRKLFILPLLHAVYRKLLS